MLTANSDDLTNTIDFSKAREDCVKLADEAAVREQRILEVEARIYFARFVVLECCNSTTDPSQLDESRQLKCSGQQQLAMARQICSKFPDQTASMQAELEAVDTMLKDGKLHPISFSSC